METLESRLTENINKIKTEVDERLEKLSVLVKDGMQDLSLHDTQTNEMIRMIHSARDEQVRVYLNPLSINIEMCS